MDKREESSSRNMPSNLSKIQQQVNGFLEMAEKQSMRVQSNPNVHRAKKLIKDISETISKLNEISTRVLSVAISTSNKKLNVETIRAELLACGNKLLVVAGKTTQGTTGQENVEDGDVIQQVSVQNYNNDEKHLKNHTAKHAHVAHRSLTMVALVNNIKVTKKHRFDGVTKCYGCMKQCLLKEIVSQCLNCKQLMHKKCFEQRQSSCPHCQQSFYPKSIGK